MKSNENFINKLLEKFNASITFDKRMYEEDITGSIAHSRMLAKQGIIAENEQKDIENTQHAFARRKIRNARYLRYRIGKKRSYDC